MDEIIHRIEYYRSAVALVPAPESEDPGLAVWVGGAKPRSGALTCNCRTYRETGRCPHTKALSRFIGKYWKTPPEAEPDVPFRQSIWCRMAAVLHEVDRIDPEEVAVEKIPGKDTLQEGIQLTNGRLRLAYFPRQLSNESPGGEERLFLERCSLEPVMEQDFHRATVLNLMARMTLTETERKMAEKGYQTRRQALETGFWYRFAYHCYRISGDKAVKLSAAGDLQTGGILIHCHWAGKPMFELELPRTVSQRVLSRLVGDLENPEHFRVYPEALESIVRMEADADHNLILTLCFRLSLPDGTKELFERKQLRKFWHQDAVYFPDRGFFATVKQPDVLWEKFGGKYRKRIKRHRVPELLDQIGINLFGTPHIIDESVRQIRVHSGCQGIEILPQAIERDWYWLSISYEFGQNAKVSLSELYQAKKSGQRFVPVADGWVDARAMDLESLFDLPGSPFSEQLEGQTDALKLSRLDLLRLKVSAEADLTVSGASEKGREQIERILAFSPPSPYSRPEGLATGLRAYQKRGVEWLLFLYENRFGGLLCDDMGLGKTHQVMALMACVTADPAKAGPFLVVCPTSVISHWERKITEHAPGLAPLIYHGADRELDGMDQPGQVLITSYGILVRDIAVLSGYGFALAAFDEAQYIKNPETKSYAAAQAVHAAMKLAVTGTPIENRLAELKALMDLCLPGYLGTDAAFEARYGEIGDGGPLKRRKNELNRVIAPFTLRRLKAAVLTELPEKIEDIRYCRLTEAQVRLYREAVSENGKGLIRSLENMDQTVPYIHIFALLTLLKQICDHPAIIDPDRSKKADLPLDSGKWELFKELLGTCLDAGRKVVVYSQFVAMIRMIEQYLGNSGIDAVSLTGRTRNRAQVIDRFNQDPACRVFVGSLKAGGTGIDLTAGSVVIHYDRWWNAAREDQATDRVHRIGQNRGVQVFKLVTEGTLEEKISAIISRKKSLMADIVQADDPGVLKTFSRDELADLLSVPG